MTPPVPRFPPGTLPPGARAVATPLADAVAAAQVGAAAAFEESTRRLLLADPEHVRVALGGATRALLEDLHPDGVGGDELQDVITRCVRSASPWFSGIDPGVIVVVLGGALGVHEDSQPVAGADDGVRGAVEDAWAQPPARPAADDVTRHAVVVLADLVSRIGRPLRGYVEASFAEIAREETVEFP